MNETTPIVAIEDMNQQQVNAKSASLANGINSLQYEVRKLVELQKEVAIRKSVLVVEKLFEEKLEMDLISVGIINNDEKEK